MICSIHQPNYIPYIGLFDKIKSSDIFVFYDNAQFTKGDYHNRNTIKGPNGKILLSLPVKVNLGQLINEVTFDNKILKKHWVTIEQSYKKSIYFNEFKDQIYEIFCYPGNNLSEFNILTITEICKLLKIKTKLYTLSKISGKLESKNTQALVDICKIVGATEYISGSGGSNYIDESIFLQNEIKLYYQKFSHPIYDQLWGDFIPYLSIIDFIFNKGNNF